MQRSVITVGFSSLALLAGMATTTAVAAGPSTPGAVVTARDPGTSSVAWQIRLDARADAAGVPAAALDIQVAGMQVTDFTAHRVAVGDTSCSGDEAAAPTAQGAGEGGVDAAVRGVGLLPLGGGLLPDGSAVQVWIDLKDVGWRPNEDQARVRLRPAPHGDEETPAAEAPTDDGDSCGGGMTEWTYDSQWQPIQQVTTYVRPAPPAPEQPAMSSPLAGIAAVATPVCKVLPPAPAPGVKTVTFTLTARQLLINQRIGQAAIRRLNAVRARLDGGLAARDLCGYSIGASELGSGITSNLAAVSLAPVAPADPAPIVDPGRATKGDPMTVTARQLLINQRIYQAALRRAQGIENRLNAGLTGGDIAGGQVVQGKLSDRLRIVTATPTPEPAPSTTVIPGRRTPADPGSVTLDIRQLKINQRIAQAGVRDANALIRRMETGLSGTDLQPGTLTAADLG